MDVFVSWKDQRNLSDCLFCWIYGDWISNYYFLVDVMNEWFMLFLQKNLRLEQNLREIQFWHLSVTRFDVYYRKPLAHCTSFSALLHSIEMLSNGFWKVCVSVGAPILLFLKSQSLDLRAHLRVPTCGWLNLTECEVSLMRRASCALLSRWTSNWGSFQRWRIII